MPLGASVTAMAALMPSSGARWGSDGTTVLDQEFGASALSGLRAAVMDCATAAGLSIDRAMDVMLALHELAANAIRHGSGRGRLRIVVTARALRCRVSDAGAGRADAEAARAPRAGTAAGATKAATAAAAPAETAAGAAPAETVVLDTAATARTGTFRTPPAWPVQHGHGLWLVRHTADLVQVTTGPAGTVIDVGFNLPDAGRQ
jgi:two-component sensor histidine kinase